MRAGGSEGEVCGRRERGERKEREGGEGGEARRNKRRGEMEGQEKKREWEEGEGREGQKGKAVKQDCIRKYMHIHASCAYARGQFVRGWYQHEFQPRKMVR